MIRRDFLRLVALASAAVVAGVSVFDVVQIRERLIYQKANPDRPYGNFSAVGAMWEFDGEEYGEYVEVSDKLAEAPDRERKAFIQHVVDRMRLNFREDLEKMNVRGRVEFVPWEKAA